MGMGEFLLFLRIANIICNGSQKSQHLVERWGQGRTSEDEGIESFNKQKASCAIHDDLLDTHIDQIISKG